MTPELGKRYERLLFMTAPISVASIIMFLVGWATSTQQDRVDAACYSQAATAIDQRLFELESAWKSEPPTKSDPLRGSQYRLALGRAWIYGSGVSNCYEFIDKKIDEHNSKPPAEIAAVFRNSAAELRKKPLDRVYGITLPQDTKFDLFGTTLQIELVSFTRILQIVFFPVVIMWLASLFHTRQRETLFIGRADSLEQIYPHVINVYPVGRRSSPRKRSIVAAYEVEIAGTSCAAIRIVLLSIFILPPVGAYLGSLWFMAGPSLSSYAYSFIAAVFCFISVMNTLVAEFALHHSWRLFPPPDVS